jgi:peptide deformylase
MSVRPILLLSDVALRTPATKVTEFGPELDALLEDLYDTMRAAPGAGLAANQIGNPLHVAVVEAEGRRYELINASIVRRLGTQTEYEGCLSIPPYVAEVERSDFVHFKTQDRFGDWRKYNVWGFLARAVQHELDHLAGKLYIDYVAKDALVYAGEPMPEDAK